MRIGLITAACLIVLAAMQSRGEERPLLAEEVVARIQQAEANADRPIEVKGFAGQNFVQNADGEYVATQKKIEGDIVRDGKAGGRYLVRYTETYPVGASDSATYTSRTRIESYDGEETRVIVPPTRRADGRERRGRVTIDSGDSAGQMLKYASLCDGSGASLGHFQGFLDVQDSKSPLLGDALAKMLESKVALAVAHDRVGDTPAIRLSDPFGSSYWFDPAKGFCLIQAISTEQAIAGKLAYRKLVIDELTPLGNGRWYPTKGRWEDPIVIHAKLDDRIAFSMQSAAYGQDPHFSFAAAIPPDYDVIDLLRGTIQSRRNASTTTRPAE